MDTVLCDISAFRLHRVPPQVVAVMPSLASVASSASRLAFARHPTTKELLGSPVHRLCFDRSRRNGGKGRNFKDHLWSYSSRGISIESHPIGCEVTSPLYTLLFLARHVTFEQLLMAMYEMCGTFAVFRPSRAIEFELSKLPARFEMDGISNWERVINADGSATDLWKRPPLVAVDELQKFADESEGLTGHKAFAFAAKYLTGVTASPFEAQASMLLGLPRCLGGEGFAAIENNKRIFLTRNASNLALRGTCYADLYIEAHGDIPPLDIECHGRGVHGGERASLSDAERATGLESMGINVVQLTHGQIQNRARFEGAIQLIADLQGVRVPRKSDGLKKKENVLRQQIFSDWATLCS